jgi:hypothetical protein
VMLAHIRQGDLGDTNRSNLGAFEKEFKVMAKAPPTVVATSSHA